MKRRDFLYNSSLISAGLLLDPWRLPARKENLSLLILHTNDVHSHLDPWPSDHKRYAGLGGVEARVAMIDRYRMNYEHVLLFDCGDIFQGTAYFNFFLGEPELKTMSAMKYDAATIGNHDFDGGVYNLADQYDNHASFDLLNCNYEVAATPLADIVKKYRIIRKGPLKIGITGVGVELEGLVPIELFKGVQYKDPVNPLNEVAEFLKEEKNCDYVICLSHLGYRYSSDKIDDVKLAAASQNIDLILGGHSHTFMEKPAQVTNIVGRTVFIQQAGWGGVSLGVIEVNFSRGKPNTISAESKSVGSAL